MIALTRRRQSYYALRATKDKGYVGQQGKGMFKNAVFITLLMVCGSTQVYAASSTPKVSFIEMVKNSRGLGKWLGAIIPCALASISAHVAIKMNKDYPDRTEVVTTSRVIRFLSFIVGCFFLNDWMDTDFKQWSLSGSKRYQF